MKLLLLSALLLAALGLGLYNFERANLYIPARALTLHPGAYAIAFENVFFEAQDEVLLHGWFVPAMKPGARCLVFFHGNGGNVSDRLEKLRLFRELGLSVFLFDYRGYGKSAGRPHERGTYLDGEAAVAWLSQTQGLPPEKLVYYGESLGAAVALETALAKPPGALILDGAFTSTVEMAERYFPLLPARLSVRNRYDNRAKIGRLKAPLLVVHSREDEIVPYAMGEALFQAAPEPKAFLETRGGHNESVLGEAPYRAALAAFLARRI